MLRIFQNSQVDRARGYYTTSDYYSEGQELTGRWRGEAARKLGLDGDVKQAEWDALCENRHPATGDQLTVRQRQDRTVGYDFNWHVPKSVSLLYAMTKDERILDAFRDAVDGTMHDMEAEMATRVRKDGKNEDRKTGNMAWGEFIHFTSRPVDGVPDPHLHAHCFVFNTTWDDKEQAWKAGQFRELKRDAPYFEAVFHSRLAHRLAELGLPIERSKHGWELGGIDRDTIDKFSRRTQEVKDREKEVLKWLKEEKGIELDQLGPEVRGRLGAESRKSKRKDLTFPELQAEWHDRMTPEEQEAIESLEAKIGGDAEPADDMASARAVKYAIDHCFERKSVIEERRFLAEALGHAVGKATVEEVEGVAAATDLIRGERAGRKMVTTKEVLGEERRMIDFARKGRGTCKPFVVEHEEFKRDWLSDEQKKAVEHVVGSRDRVVLVRGAAGVGKTSLMQEAVEAIQATGTKVTALAPSANASRGVLREAGFKDAETVARFLLDEKMQQQAAGQLIWIDEAGLVGTKTMSNVFAVAERIGARILLSGDRRQHGSVERGAALRLLEDEAGVKPAEVKEIQRQTGAYKDAVKALGEGKTFEGFNRLDSLGWVREIADDERYKVLAADYVQAVGDGKTALVVSPSHAEGNRITSEIRQALRSSGVIGSSEHAVPMLVNRNLTEAERGDAVNYQSGDMLVFHQNAKGHQRGERISVEAGQPPPLDQANRFEAFAVGTLELSPGDQVRITHNGMTADQKHRLNNGAVYRVERFDVAGNIVLENGWTVAKDFGHLAHGYVVTSHASQGRTVDVALIGQSSESFPASSREQFYVSASRARKQVVVYTSDKESLREAIEQSDDRLSATEMVANERKRRAVALRQRDRDMAPEPPHREKERELVYE